MDPLQLYQPGAAPDLSPYATPTPIAPLQAQQAQAVSPLNGLAKVVANYTQQQRQKTQQQRFAEALRQMQAAQSAGLPGDANAQGTQ